jgi:hypothetical protein
LEPPEQPAARNNSAAQLKLEKRSRVMGSKCSPQLALRANRTLVRG